MVWRSPSPSLGHSVSPPVLLPSLRRPALGAAPEDVLAAVSAGEGERLMGAIWYGYPAKELANDAKSPPRKKGLDGVLKKLP